MNTSPNAKLLEWVRKLSVDLTPEGAITRLELWHSIEGEAGERLCTIEMADRDDDEDPDDLTQELWNESEEDASTRPQGSYQRYVVQAFRGDVREPEDQKAYVITGRAVSSLTGLGTEPPTGRGETAQGMRHRDDLHALVVRMCEATSGSTAVQLQKEREYNDKLMERVRKTTELEQDLLDRKQERDLRAAEFEAGQQRLQMLLQTANQLLPVLLTKFLTPPPGGNAASPPPLEPAAVPLGVSPEQAAPGPAAAPAPHPGQTALSPAIAPQLNAAVARDHSVGTLLSTVKPEQMQVLLGTFDEAQTLAFMEIYGSYRDAAQAAAAQQAARAGKNEDPSTTEATPPTTRRTKHGHETSN